MARVREGSRGALLVVDVQVDVMDGAWDSERITRNVARSVERARKAGFPVIWIQHADEELVRDSRGWEWVPELRPAEDELLIHKEFNSAFEETALEESLDQQGISHIVLAGAATNWCIRSTAYGALDRGYDLTLIEDAHTTRTVALGSGETLEAARVVDDLNMTMGGVAYPGLASHVAAAEGVDFADLGPAR